MPRSGKKPSPVQNRQAEKNVESIARLEKKAIAERSSGERVADAVTRIAEGTMVLRMLQRIAKHLGIKEEQDKELSQLQEQTNVSQLAHRLEKKLPG